MPTESIDIVQSEWAPRLCPEYPQTLSRLSTDFYGQCPGSPWKLSNEPMDSVDI